MRWSDDDNTYSDNLGHLLGLNGSVSVHVVHLERPLELLFRLSSRRDVYCQQELFEVDLPAVVWVKCAEHVLAELVSVTLWEETRVDFEKLGPRQLSAWAVSLQRHVSNVTTSRQQS